MSTAPNSIERSEQALAVMSSLVEHDTHVWWATRKTITLELAAALLGIAKEKLEGYDPEQKNHFQQAATEPSVDEPAEAVEFKLDRIEEFYNLLYFYSLLNPDLAREQIKRDVPPQENTVMIAGDVVMFVDGVPCHSLVHDDKGSELHKPTPAMLKVLRERYKRPRNIEWRISWGMIKNGRRRIAGLSIEADIPKLTKKDIITHFNPPVSGSMEMVGLVADHFPTIPLFATFSPDGERVPISQVLAERLIVAKLPTVEMFEELLEAIVQNRAAVFSNVMLALGNERMTKLGV